MSNIATHGEKLFANTRKKITVVIIAVSMLVMILFSGIVMFTYSMVMFRNVDIELERYKVLETTMLNDFFGNNSMPDISGSPDENIFGDEEKPGDKGILGNYADESAMKYIRFLLVDGKLIWSSSDGYYTDIEQPEISDFSEGKVLKFRFEGERFRGFSVTKNNVTVITAINVTPEYNSISKVAMALIIGLVLVLAFELIVARYYSKKIVAPIKDAYVKQAFFIQDASHEIRTPLSVIRGKIELVAQHPTDEIQEHSQELSDIACEITAMEKMSTSLLMLSKEDSFTRREISSFKLSDMLSELSDELFSMLAELQEKQFSFAVMPQDMTVSWDYAKMKQAFTILLDNAFKYTDTGDEIRITATQGRDGNVTVSFYDSGRGIKQEELSRIFDRFYRSADVRAQEISGSGIGLSLLNLLGNNLGFKIKVSSEYESFTEFVITAPSVMK